MKANNWMEYTYNAMDVLRRPREGNVAMNEVCILFLDCEGEMHCWHIEIGKDCASECCDVIYRKWRSSDDYPDTEELEKKGLAEGSPEYREAALQQLPLFPTTDEVRYRISRENASRFVASLRSRSLPVVEPTFPSGCGETATWLSYGSAFSHVSFSWWGEGPSEWSHIIRDTGALIRHLDECSRQK